jgi:molybdate transport system substrate-binding protein
MTPIKIISSMATRATLAALASRYEQSTGQAVLSEAVAGVEAAKRVRNGDPADLVVLADNVIDQLIAEGKLRAGSRVDLVTSGINVAVRAGAPKPDIGSEEAMKRTVLAARTVSYSTGPSGIHLERLFARWGIADEIAARIVHAPPGVPVGSLIAKGEAELGFQQLSEMMHIEGIQLLGPLPAAIQSITTFSAGVSPHTAQPDAVKALLDFLVSPAATPAKRKNGLEPA